MKITAMIIGFLILAVPAAAEEKTDDWKFVITPYLWMMSATGNVTANGVTADFDLPFSDILKDLHMAAMGRGEAWKGCWGLTVDSIYAYLKSDATIDTPVESLGATVRTRLFMIDVGGGWRLGEMPLGEDQGPASIGFDLLGGARYGYTKNTIEGDGGFLDTSQSADWWTPYIGGRIRIRANEMWSFIVRGDIGGFDTGDAPHFIWNALVAVDMAVSRVVSIDLAFRSLGINGQALDATFYGPALGATFRF